jgi:putative MATE family efflux protein
MQKKIFPMIKDYLSIFVSYLIPLSTIFLFIIFDMYFISKLGEEKLASVGLVIPINSILISILGGMSISIGIKISSSYGANLKERMKLKIWINSFLTLSLAFSLMFIYFIFQDYIFSIFNTTENIIEDSKTYLNVFILLLPIESIFIIYSFVLNVIGFYKLRIYSSIAIVFINIFLDYILIFGFQDIIPPLGLFGAALATFISQLLLTILYFIILYKHNYLIFINKQLLKTYSIIKKIIYNAFMNIITNIFTFTSIFLYFIIISSFTVSEIAGYSVMSRVELFVALIARSSSSALMILLGRYLGKKRYQDIPFVLNISNLLVFLWGVILVISIFFFGEDFGALFFKKQTDIILFNNMLMILISGIVALGIARNFEKIFISLEKPTSSVFIKIFQILSILFVISYFSNIYGIEGFLYSQLILSFIILFIHIIIYYFYIYPSYIKNKTITNQNININSSKI